MIRFIVCILFFTTHFSLAVLAEEISLNADGEIENLQDIGDEIISVDEDNLVGQPDDNTSEIVREDTPDDFFARGRDEGSSHSKRGQALSAQIDSKLQSGELSEQEVERIKYRLEKRDAMFDDENTLTEQQQRRLLLIEKQKRREAAR